MFSNESLTCGGSTQRTLDEPQPQFVSAKLPIDRESIRSRRLLDMIEQVEALHAPGNRTVFEMLLDAGADSDRLQYRDPKDDSHAVFSAALQFRVDTAKLKGFVVVEDDPDNRCYSLLVQREGCIGFEVVKRVTIRSLAADLHKLVDDGERRWSDIAFNVKPVIIAEAQEGSSPV